jgi:hypothetical protein
MKKRMVWTSIDSLVAVLRDYLGTEVIPAGAKPVKLQIHPTERVFAVVIDGDEIPEGASPVRATFDIKRVFGLGGM